MALITSIILSFFFVYSIVRAENSADVIRIEVDDHKNNLTALASVIAPPWVSSQGIRSTSDIIWSSVLTLIACIYTALHLNVSTKPDLKRRLLEKAKWVFTTVFVPEIVLLMAFSQYLEARWLVKELNNAHAQMKPNDQDKDNYTFDMRYAFFVVMGGVQLPYYDIIDDENEDGDSWFAENYKVKTISAEGMVCLAKAGGFIYLPREIIDDRSKANAFQKTLVVVQVTWMVTQCIARRAYGLPITLLELHVIVHVICALILYVFWFEKPLDVVSPELVDLSSSEELRNLSSLLLYEELLINGEHEIPAAYLNLKPLPPPNDDIEGGLPVVDLKSMLQNQAVGRLKHGEILRIERQSEDIISTHLQPKNIIPYGVISHVREPVVSPKVYLMLQRVIASRNKISDPIYIDDEYNFGLMKECNQSHMGLDHLVYKHRKISAFHSPANFPTNGSRTQPITDGIVLQNTHWLLQLSIYLLPIIYGGIHLVAWNFHFPTEYEQIIWKISCLIVVGASPALGLIVHGGIYSSLTFQYLYHLEYIGTCGMILGALITVVIIFLICTLLAFWAAARFYIVVEAFISLRAVPIGVYWTPQWLQSGFFLSYFIFPCLILLG
ncbi:hypothetical protein M426DRAFT_261416 [Hypoxylon sp. CI-4A]|nr:hypothetical protein M426DRAFT_261416 [Hypoxylon sp. CI-4A]